MLEICYDLRYCITRILERTVILKRYVKIFDFFSNNSKQRTAQGKAANARRMSHDSFCEPWGRCESYETFTQSYKLGKKVCIQFELDEDGDHEQSESVVDRVVSRDL